MAKADNGAAPAPKSEDASQAGSEPDAVGTVPVVGIGASAGGLDAFERFLGAMPPESGMAFVFVQHLAPDHESQLADLLQRRTPMPVRQVGEAMPVRANHVYVIPANSRLTISEGALHLSPIEQDRLRRAPIDLFLRSLAEDQGEHAVGIILSGTGTDGALGLRAIKEGGGMTMVQDPDDAAYDGMPANALRAGGVDVTLPVDDMPDRLLRYVNHNRDATSPAIGVPLSGENATALKQIFDLLHDASGNDFSHYKRSTVLRRLARRMQVHHLDDLSAYADYLKEHLPEVDALFQDLLISVTSFFRDPDLFEVLKETVIPPLAAEKGGDELVRVWVPGCATGEEAYSIAILLLEEAERHTPQPEVQVFATDIDRTALEFARLGMYPEAVAEDLTPERLDRFFVREGNSYKVRSTLSDTVLFAEHNLLNDPPFLNLDLISCRNLLIYLERDLQESVFELFHYALRPNGYVFLGTSESMPSDSILFAPVAGQSSLLRRQARPEGRPRLPSLPMRSRKSASPQGPIGAALAIGQRDSLAEQHRQRVLARYGEPSVLVNQKFNVIHIVGGADRYLQVGEGEFSRSIIDMVDPRLRLELRSMLLQLFQQGITPEPRQVHIRSDGARRSVRLIVEPMDSNADHTLAEVLFEEGALPEPKGLQAPDESVTGRDETDDVEQIIRQLEDELNRTKERLSVTVDEYETTNEELRASNEELQSMNEELKSTAEELETSKEELQSMNEELTTINQELKNKIEELNRANSDLQNLFSATDIATLFLDRNMQLRRYTPPVEDLFNVIPGDVGRPLSHLTHHLKDPDLVPLAQQVIDRLVPVDREVQSNDGQWFIMRVLPYRTIDDRIEGVVIAFINITARKRAEEKMRAAKQYAEHIVETVQEPLLVLTPDLRVQSANTAFYAQFPVSSGEAEGRLIYELNSGMWDIPELRRLLGEVLPENETFNQYQVELDGDALGHRVLMLNGRRLDGRDLILLAIHDITKQKEAERTIQEAREKAERQARVRASFLGNISHEIRTPLSGLLGFADMLADQLDGTQRETAVLVRRSGERLLDTMDSILDLARMEAGAFEAKRDELDAVLEVKEATQLLDPVAERKGAIRLTFESPLDTCPALLDRGFLNRILNNLMGNAIKFTPEGQVAVRLDTESGASDDEDDIVLTVSDTGVGISESFLPHVFDEFRQEHAAISDTSGGAGLGLTLTKHLVETMDGTITVESTKGEGTTFTVRLPWKKPADA